MTLPNNLANEALVPELLQEAVTPDAVAQAVAQMMHLPTQRRDYVLQCFQRLHGELRRDASRSAARAIMGKVLKC